jgi:hypothetical protein
MAVGNAKILVLCVRGEHALTPPTFAHNLSRGTRAVRTVKPAVGSKVISESCTKRHPTFRKTRVYADGPNLLCSDMVPLPRLRKLSPRRSHALIHLQEATVDGITDEVNHFEFGAVIHFEFGAVILRGIRRGWQCVRFAGARR